jgi:hypothetical protein
MTRAESGSPADELANRPGKETFLGDYDSGEEDGGGGLEMPKFRLMSGYMQKKGSVNKAWKRRFFVFDRQTKELSYYRHEDRKARQGAMKVRSVVNVDDRPRKRSNRIDFKGVKRSGYPLIACSALAPAHVMPGPLQGRQEGGGDVLQHGVAATEAAVSQHASPARPASLCED